MSVPPPLVDPSHIETRLLIVAEMLDRAVAEVRRAMAELSATAPVTDEPQPPEPDAGRDDGR